MSRLTNLVALLSNILGVSASSTGSAGTRQFGGTAQITRACRTIEWAVVTASETSSRSGQGGECERCKLESSGPQCLTSTNLCDTTRRELTSPRGRDLWLVGRDNEYKDFWLVSARADAGFVASRRTGCMNRLPTPLSGLWCA